MLVVSFVAQYLLGICPGFLFGKGIQRDVGMFPIVWQVKGWVSSGDKDVKKAFFVFRREIRCYCLALLRVVKDQQGAVFLLQGFIDKCHSLFCGFAFLAPDFGKRMELAI